MTALHLRSTERPEFERTRQGVIFVWTECGRRVNAIIVDNEHATCVDCNAIDKQLRILADLERDGILTIVKEG